MHILAAIIRETVSLWIAMAPYLLVGMMVAGMLHLFLGKAFISRHLGSPGIASVIKATVLGIPLPVCSCGVIPLASSLQKEGAHRSSVLSFLVSTPATGVDSIFATYALMGPLFAIFRPLQALVAGIATGLADLLFGKRVDQPSAVPDHSHAPVAGTHRLREFLRYSFIGIPGDIGLWLVVGTLIGGIITAMVPQSLVTRYVAFPFDFAAALLFGLPVYVCATGSIPIAASLIDKGFTPGAGLIFLIVGPATNAITLSFVRARMGARSFWLYLTVIIVTAVLFGLAFNALWSFFGSSRALITGGGAMLPVWLQNASGVALLALVAAPFVIRRRSCTSA